MQTPEEVAAALVSPWPIAWVERPSEGELLEVLARLGPLPQADILVPWEDEPWCARVLRPPLDRAAELLAVGRLEAGDPPGYLEWEDRGRVLVDTLEHPPFRAILRSDAHHGGALVPDLIDGGEDPLDGPLKRLLGDPRARAVTVVHPTTGRHGVRLSLPEGPEPDRDTALRSIAPLLAKADPPVDRTLRWWFELGWVHFLAWKILPPRRPLPPPHPWPAGAMLDRWNGAVELQVLLPPDRHETEAMRLAERLGAAGLAGSRPRFLGDRLLACWSGPTSAAGTTVDPPHRWLPGCPPGLEAAWIGIDPEHWVAHGRTFTRWRCSLRDRDLLPQLAERPADATDRRLAHLLGSFGRVDPVRGGFAGLRLRVPALRDDRWETLLDLLGALPEPAIGPVVHVRMGTRYTLLLERDDLPRERPTWSAG